MSRQRRRLLLLAGAVIALLVWSQKPADLAVWAQKQRDPAELRYFRTVSSVLSGTSSLPLAVVDLDRLDHNVAQAKAALSETQQFRLVVKSLPSLGLLRYLVTVSGTQSLMVFHAPQIATLLDAFSDLPKLDILLGKPAPAASALAVLRQHPQAAQRVQWLIDDQDRLRAYRDVAKQTGLVLRVSVELDVGLHRGGVQTDDALRALLDEISSSEGQLQLSGFMGYDGHVPHAPGLPKQAAIHKALVDVQTRYRQLVEVARAHRPALFADGAPRLCLNSGGSKTLPLYRGLPTVVNDMAMGSGLLRPANFDDDALRDFVPALWLAVPILKKQVAPPLPFLDGMWGLLRRFDPNLEVGFFLYGGTWDAPIVYPVGLSPGYFNDGKIHNLLPNQQLLTGSRHVEAEVGSFVLLHPREADNFAALSDLYAIRAGKLEARWQPLSPLN